MNPRKNKYSCSDRMCGAEDCSTCRPGCESNLTQKEIEELESKEIDKWEEERRWRERMEA